MTKYLFADVNTQELTEFLSKLHQQRCKVTFIVPSVYAMGGTLKILTQVMVFYEETDI